MAYTPNTWQDRTGTGLNKFTDQNGNEYEFTPTPDEITQQGTPFSAAWMNHIEQGIKDNSDNFPVSIANGGTGATTAATARENLGVAEAGNPVLIPDPIYNGGDDTSEDDLQSWLDSVISDMDNYSVRLVRWSCAPITGSSCIGILYKYSNTYCAMFSYTYLRNVLFLKIKDSTGWYETINLRTTLPNTAYGTSLPAAGTPGRIFFLKA